MARTHARVRPSSLPPPAPERAVRPGLSDAEDEDEFGGERSGPPPPPLRAGSEGRRSGKDGKAAAGAEAAVSPASAATDSPKALGSPKDWLNRPSPTPKPSALLPLSHAALSLLGKVRRSLSVMALSATTQSAMTSSAMT